MTQTQAVSVETETVHPLRAAVEAAEREVAEAQQALDAIAEPADDCAEGHRVSHAEDRLREAQLALVGSDCPRQWDLREEGYEYDEITADSVEEALEEARSNVDRSNYGALVGSGARSANDEFLRRRRMKARMVPGEARRRNFSAEWSYIFKLGHTERPVVS
jgi:multidrug resistance efflux pump